MNSNILVVYKKNFEGVHDIALKQMIECLEKLVISKLKCYYCKKDCLITYENVRENTQWTLDRINNDKGHNKDNVVISCLKCNLKRGTLNDEKFKFTKQMYLIKTL